MLRILSVAVLALLVLAACAGTSAPVQQASSPEEGEPVVTVFKSPT
jgi:hypothetical protein